MKKEARIISSLMFAQQDAKLFNNAVELWKNRRDITFKETLILLAKQDNSFKQINLDDIEVQKKVLKMIESHLVFITLYNMLIISQQICEDILNENEFAKYINGCEIITGKSIPLKNFLKRLRNNLVHNNFDDLGMTLIGAKKYIITLPQSKNSDAISLELTENEIVRLLYFSTVFWNVNNNAEFISQLSFSDAMKKYSGENLSLKGNFNDDDYYYVLSLQAHKLYMMKFEEFNEICAKAENNPKEFKYDLNKSIIMLSCIQDFYDCALALDNIKTIFKIRDVKYSEIEAIDADNILRKIIHKIPKIARMFKPPFTNLKIPKLDEKVRYKKCFDKYCNKIPFHIIAKVILGNLDENYFNNLGDSKEYVKNLRNSIIHSRYARREEDQTYILFKKRNLKSTDIQCFGEISKQDLERLIDLISENQYSRSDIREYYNSKINKKQKNTETPNL